MAVTPPVTLRGAPPVGAITTVPTAALDAKAPKLSVVAEVIDRGVMTVAAVLTLKGGVVVWAASGPAASNMPPMQPNPRRYWRRCEA